MRKLILTVALLVSGVLGSVAEAHPRVYRRPRYYVPAPRAVYVVPAPVVPVVPVVPVAPVAVWRPSVFFPFRPWRIYWVPVAPEESPTSSTEGR